MLRNSSALILRDLILESTLSDDSKDEMIQQLQHIDDRLLRYKLTNSALMTSMNREVVINITTSGDVETYSGPPPKINETEAKIIKDSLAVMAAPPIRAK